MHVCLVLSAENEHLPFHALGRCTCPPCATQTDCHTLPFISARSKVQLIARAGNLTLLPAGLMVIAAMKYKRVKTLITEMPFARCTKRAY